MEMQTFVRIPFTVEAVQITTENIVEIAPLVGTLRTKDGQFYIEVDRKKVPNLYEVHPGFWMTTMNGKVRCYTEHIFEEQFTALTPEINEWVEFLNATNEATEEEAAVTSG